jgi:hypothetical protein
MILPLLVAILGVTTGDPAHDAIRLWAWGGSPARGELVNWTRGVAPGSPPDPSRPTLVVVHGVNPAHPLLRMTVAERYAEAIARRYGPAVNVLGWDWNAAARGGLRPGLVHRDAIEQGRRLAATLRMAGFRPADLRIVGQSTGCLVAAAAARSLADGTGEFVGVVTLCDPVRAERELVFGPLEVVGAAASVEHFWAPGLSGFGGPAPTSAPNLLERRIPGPRGARGLLRPAHTDHLNVVRWHINALSEGLLPVVPNAVIPSTPAG